MTQDAEHLLAEALRLTPQDRAAIASRLLDSIDDQVDADAEAAWDRTIAERIEQLDRGEVQGVPWAQVRRQLNEHG